MTPILLFLEANLFKGIIGSEKANTNDTYFHF